MACSCSFTWVDNWRRHSTYSRPPGQLDQVTARHADMFDCPTCDYCPPIAVPPERQLAVGTDLKPNLLAKAGALHLYERLVEHDGNRPLPFEDGTFQTTYCNAAYWIEQVDPFLRELARITASRGRVILQVKLDSMKSYTLEGYRAELGDVFLDIIGRGRLATWPSLTGRQEWEKRFQRAGFDVGRCEAVGDSHPCTDLGHRAQAYRAVARSDGRRFVRRYARGHQT